MVFIQFFSRKAYANSEYYSGLLQIVMVDASVNVSLSNGTKHLLTDQVYQWMLILSLALYLLIQTDFIVDIEEKKGLIVFYIIITMIIFGVILKIINTAKRIEK